MVLVALIAISVKPVHLLVGPNSLWVLHDEVVQVVRAALAHSDQVVVRYASQLSLRVPARGFAGLDVVERTLKINPPPPQKINDGSGGDGGRPQSLPVGTSKGFCWP